MLNLGDAFALIGFEFNILEKAAVENKNIVRCSWRYLLQKSSFEVCYTGEITAYSVTDLIYNSLFSCTDALFLRSCYNGEN